MIHTHVSVGDQKSPMNFGDVKKHWTFTTFTKPCSMEDDFKCPNFLVSTGSALVVLVESKLFYELSPENRRGGVPPNHPFSIGSFHYKPSILGYPHFWKPHITYIYLSLSLYIYIYQFESYKWSQKSQKMMQNTRSKWSKIRSFGLNLGAASTVRRSISVTGPGFASPWLVLSSTASAGGGLRLLRISAHVEPLTDGWWGVVFQNTPPKGRKMLEGVRSWSNPKRWA